MYIHIVGTGHLARVLGAVSSDAGISSGVWRGDGSDKLVADTVVVHVGSGRQLAESLRWSGANGLPFIQASSGQDELLPRSPPCPVILAPNLALPVAKFFEVLPQVAAVFKELGMSVEITESHQARKKTVAGTGRVMARIVGIPEAAIHSVRNPSEQEALGVPTEHLAAHAYHWITFSQSGLKVQLSTQIEGFTTYANDALKVAEKLIAKRSELQNKIYSVPEILAL